MRILILIGLLLSSTHTLADKQARITPESLLATAARFLDGFADRQAAEGYQVSYELGNLDSRLRLAPCSNEPDVEFSGDPWSSTRPRLMISCEGERPWKLFLSSSLTIEGETLVAARPLSRGDRIREDMISTTSMTVNASRRKSISHRSELIGMELDRSITTGTAFTPDLVSAPDAVARGDHVIITARSGHFSVQSRGKALNNGRIGEQVLIENLASSKTLRARITGPGHVEIPM